MWKDDNSSILILDDNQSRLSEAKKVCDDKSIICYGTNSSYEAIKMLMNHQIDGVLVFQELFDALELIRTFSTIMCTAVTFDGGKEPIGADNEITGDQFKVEDIPKYLKKMMDDTTKKTQFKGLVWFRRLRLDMDNYTVDFGDTPIKMKPLEIKLLFYLLKHLNRVVSRKRLLFSVWNYEQGGATRTLDVHIMALRALIEKYEIPLGIETLRGQGYKLYDLESNGGADYFDVE